MYKRKLLVAIFLFVFMTSCFVLFKNYYHDSNGIGKPKNPKFKLAKPPYPYQLKTDDLIDVNSIYIAQTRFKDSIYTPIKRYLQFFKNGRVSSRFKVIEAKESKPIDYNNFSHGFIGYYKIDDKNKITYEFFWIHDIGRYVKRYGYIKNDSIFLFEYPYKKHGFPKPNNNNCQIYIRKKVAGLTGTADW